MHRQYSLGYRHQIMNKLLSFELMVLLTEQSTKKFETFTLIKHLHNIIHNNKQ